MFVFQSSSVLRPRSPNQRESLSVRKTTRPVNHRHPEHVLLCMRDLTWSSRERRSTTSASSLPILSDSPTQTSPRSPSGRLEEPACAFKLDPIQELSEEDKGKARGRAARLHDVCMAAPASSISNRLRHALRARAGDAVAAVSHRHVHRVAH